MSRHAVGVAIGVVERSIERWENGLTAPDLVDALHLAEFFGVSLDDMLKRG